MSDYRNKNLKNVKNAIETYLKGYRFKTDDQKLQMVKNFAEVVGEAIYVQLVDKNNNWKSKCRPV